VGNANNPGTNAELFRRGDELWERLGHEEDALADYEFALRVVEKVGCERNYNCLKKKLGKGQNLAGLIDIAYQPQPFTSQIIHGVRGRRDYLAKRALRYHVKGDRRWNLHCRNNHAYVWQLSRFPDDIAFWAEHLSDPSSVSPVKDGKSLRFKLFTVADFEAFREAVEEDIVGVRWEAPADVAVDGVLGSLCQA